MTTKNEATITPRDRKFAVTAFGVQLAGSTYKDASLFLEEIASEADHTNSSLLIHQVLRAYDEKGHRAYVRFANDVAKKAVEHGWEGGGNACANCGRSSRRLFETGLCERCEIKREQEQEIEHDEMTCECPCHGTGETK